ncbi:hypothetical protein ABZ816_06555 [Actinosynnema sp. NPDC047251]|nr:hypothetical protein [Saccharothrix espanaensis]
MNGTNRWSTWLPAAPAAECGWASCWAHPWAVALITDLAPAVGAGLVVMTADAHRARAQLTLVTFR